MTDDDSEHDIACSRRIIAAFPKGEHSFSDNLAGLLYTLQTSTACAESALGAKLTAAGIPWEDHSYDYYDYSLELLGVGDWVPTPAQIEAIGAMGFHQFWINPGTVKRSPGEKHYNCRAPRPSQQ